MKYRSKYFSTALLKRELIKVYISCVYVHIFVYIPHILSKKEKKNTIKSVKSVSATCTDIGFPASTLNISLHFV